MVWTPKSGAPTTMRVADAFLALIAGDATWSWLADYIPFLPQDSVDTAAFCALGPAPGAVPALSTTDFLSDLSNPYGWAAIGSALGGKLGLVMDDRVFGAYCEQVTAVSPLSTIHADVYAYAGHPPSSYLGQPIVGEGFTGTAVGTTALRSWPAGSGSYAINLAGVGGQCLWIRWTIGGATVDEGPFCIPAGLTSYSSGLYPSSPGAATGVQLYRSNTIVAGHNPTPQPQPAGVVAPAHGTYPDIAALGRELDSLEFKLEYLTSLVSLIAANVGLPPATSDTPTDAAAGPHIAPKAIGFRVDVAGIPPGAGEAFGTPAKYHRLGRITLGSSNGWLPSVDLEHNPMLLAPLPPGVDRCQVDTYPPATATVTALLPPK